MAGTRESWTDAVMGWLRIRNRGALIVFALAVMAYCVNAFAVHWPLCMGGTRPFRIYDAIQQVLEGTAASPYQFQMYVSARAVHGIAVVMQVVIETVLHRPILAATAVAISYWVFYFVGTVLFLITLMRLCALVAGDLAAAVACLFLAGAYPLFCFDNLLHPSDPYGCLLATLVMDRLVRKGTDGGYLALLFLSGFFWEKHLFIPLCVAALQWSQRRRFLKITLTAALGLAASIIGQIIPRLLYSGPRAWSGNTFLENIAGIPWFLLWTAILYGFQLRAVIRRDSSVDPIWRVMTLQFLIWPAIYLLKGGVLQEARGTMIMVPLTWPILALVITEALGRKAPLLAAAGGSRQGDSASHSSRSTSLRLSMFDYLGCQLQVPRPLGVPCHHPHEPALWKHALHRHQHARHPPVRINKATTPLDRISEILCRPLRGNAHPRSSHRPLSRCLMEPRLQTHWPKIEHVNPSRCPLVPQALG